MHMIVEVVMGSKKYLLVIDFAATGELSALISVISFEQEFY
jgi:hypothetical protein